MVKYFTKIWYILGDSKRQLPFLLIVVLLSSILEVVGISLLGPFFSVIADPKVIDQVPALKNLANAFNLRTPESMIAALSGLIILAFIIKSVLYFYSKYYTLKFSHNHRGRMIESLNRTYLESEYDYFVTKNSSKLINNIAVETQIFCDHLLLPLLYAVTNLVVLLLLFSLMLATDSLLLMMSAVALLPVILLTYVMKKRLAKWGKSASEGMEGAIKTLNHGLGGFKEVRVIGCASHFESQMEGYVGRYKHAAPLAGSFEFLPRTLIESNLIILIILFIVISKLVLLRDITSLLAILSVFAIASIRLIPAASQIMGTLGRMSETKYIVDLLYADLKETNSLVAQKAQQQRKVPIEQSRVLNPGLPQRLAFENKLEISNIAYRYSEDLQPAIDGISIDIRRGESIAFIGTSGAGKTTLVDIILGLLTPQIGDIKVDGISVYNNLRDWQNLVGYIPQSIFLLDDTLTRNIAFGVLDQDIDHQRLEKAINSAQLKELIENLPYGLETKVGERGVMLSGGQRQRVGIARALYHEREILILDEATAALDNNTEKLVSESIQGLVGEKTLITIAHRLSTVEKCDRIYLLEKGRVVRAGSFAEVVGTLEQKV